MSYTQSNPEKLTLKVHNNEDIKCGNLEMTLWLNDISNDDQIYYMYFIKNKMIEMKASFRLIIQADAFKYGMKLFKND